MMIVKLMLLIVIVGLFYILTYITSGRLAPKKPSREKQDIYACGEESKPVKEPLRIYVSRFLVGFAVLEAATVLALLTILAFGSSNSLNLIVTLYALLIAISAVAIARG